MPRLLGRLQTSLQLAPRALLSVKRPRKDRPTSVASTPVASVSSHTSVMSPSSTSNARDKPLRFGLRSVSRFRKFQKIAKETLLLGLQALAESAAAFPPLKSAVCGLLFFVKQVEVSACPAVFDEMLTYNFRIARFKQRRANRAYLCAY